MQADAQRQLIVEQFTKQAVPFAQLPNHNNDDTNRLVIETLRVGPDDTVLDIACGPGLITTALAKVARHVTGSDITPAMLTEARQRQAAAGLTNMTWELADVLPLPFADDTFSTVCTRYSFHHFLSPAQVLQQMTRVCQPGGTVGVIDVFMNSPEQAVLYDRMEKLRDPSHVRALLLSELVEMFVATGLTDLRTEFYKVEVELEGLLAATATPPESAEGVRQMIRADLGRDQLGIGAQQRNGAIYFGFPIVIVAGTKPC